MQQVNIHQAKTNLSKLIKKVVDGEEVIFAKRNIPIAKLVSLKSANPKRKLGTAKGSVNISPDFDLPLDDFHEYFK